jgi:hypothetical protein
MRRPRPSLRLLSWSPPFGCFGHAGRADTSGAV